MNAERLLQHHETIADAPDAIARLRRFILDLAVRGKLVPQDASDEPASELLTRIAKEKARLVKAGERRDRLAPPAVAEDEAPFGVPSTWRWVRFGNIVDFSAGRTPSRHDPSFWNTGDHAWVSIADMEDGQVVSATKETVSERARERVFGSEPEEPGTIIMSFKLTIGKIARLGVPAFHNEAIISIRPHLAELDGYLFKVLPQFARQGDTKGAIKGATLNRDSISNIILPLPPLAEQHRIVAKVDELMGLCDRLEAARAGRETVRDRLAAASLARLNAPDPETFQADALFALDALPALTTRPDQIKALRQTILNLAVRGKLVPQDARDEPAVDYLLGLPDIPAKTRRLVKALDPSGCGGDLPASWAWLPLGGIISGMDAGWSPQCENRPRSTIEEWGVLKTTAVQALSFDSMQHKLLPAKLKPRPQYQAEIGDILVTRAGPKNRVGISCVVDVPCPRLMISDKLIRFHALGELSARYVALTLNAGYTFEQVEAAKSGMAVMQMNISQDKLRAVPIPLPPVAEQHRIVAKVDALMALCDRLEASLTATAATRRRLLDALLAEALTPAEERELEAAE